jgi:predicted transcriptional regulator
MADGGLSGRTGVPPAWEDLQMTLILELPPEIERRLIEMAERQGRTPDDLAIQALGQLVAESGEPPTSNGVQQAGDGANEGEQPFGADMPPAAKERLAELGIRSREDLMARNRKAIELLRQWAAEPTDWEEAEGYPEEITPLSLREVQID